MRRPAGQGSSPRVRGEEELNNATMGILGIIPAGAGRSRLLRVANAVVRDHPRGCGEKWCIFSKKRPGLGSSPRVRGEVVDAQFRTSEVGIIPAGAGRRIDRGGQGVGQGDHPRGCGEKSVPSPSSAESSGSSPRVRGEGEQHAGQHLRPRIIPAGAGRSWPALISGSFIWDHPRGCGEKVTGGTPGQSASGSSPRVRGEGVDVQKDHLVVGIIPAGAGRRTPARSAAVRSWDHPRGCGEKA